MSQFDPNPKQFGANQPPQQTPGYYPKQSNGKAVASLVLGLLSLCFAFVAGIPAIIFGVLALGDVRRGQGRVGGQGLAIAGIILGCVGSVMTLVNIALLLPAVTAARDAARRAESSNRLKHIGLAMHNHHDTNRTLPPAYNVDQDGKPLLSWRVHILPFIEQESLYKQFKLDEPWDSSHNKRLINQMPDVYLAPGADAGTYQTVYLGVVGNKRQHTAFRDDGRGSHLAEFANDGTSNTILVVEANEDQAVIWTKPDDWNFDPQNPRRGLGEFRLRGFLALFADGSVKSIPNSVDEKTLSHMFIRNDGSGLQVQELLDARSGYR
jgi:hypothetical protein